MLLFDNHFSTHSHRKSLKHGSVAGWNDESRASFLGFFEDELYKFEFRRVKEESGTYSSSSHS